MLGKIQLYAKTLDLEAALAHNPTKTQVLQKIAGGDL